MKKQILNFMIGVFAAIFVFSAYSLISYFMESRQSQNEYDTLADIVANAQMEAALDVTSPSADDSSSAVQSELPLYVDVTDPETGETVTILRQYATLYEMNNDIVGWLKIEGTQINYPVMQTPNYPDYYLNYSFNQEYSNHGCLYAREACDINAPSDNITIYGHHMRDGSMFAGLSEYEDQNFWAEHKTLNFDTLTEQHTYEILSVFLTTATLGEGFEYHMFSDAADEAEYDAFVSTCKELSLYDTGVNAQYGDKLITLSTCEYSQTNGRLVVVAKRIDR